jgi:hypothetical protein
MNNNYRVMPMRVDHKLSCGQVDALIRAASYYLDCWETYGGKDFEDTGGLTNRQRQRRYQFMNQALSKLIESRNPVKKTIRKNIPQAY